MGQCRFPPHTVLASPPSLALVTPPARAEAIVGDRVIVLNGDTVALPCARPFPKIRELTNVKSVPRFCYLSVDLQFRKE